VQISVEPGQKLLGLLVKRNFFDTGKIETKNRHKSQRDGFSVLAFLVYLMQSDFYYRCVYLHN
jgi:hypothetical protein